MAGAQPTPAARGSSGAASAWRLSAFGLELESDFALPGLRVTSANANAAIVELRRVPRPELAPLISEPRTLRYLQVLDQCPYAMLEGARGDVLFHYGPRALFHLSADRRQLRCAPTDAEDRTWQRVLLDTVLWSASLLSGFELLHASAVLTRAGVVAFAATSGGGKTSLAAEMIRRGALPFSDDILAVEDRDGRLLAHPGPPLLNLPATSRLPGSVVIADFGEEHWVWLSRSAPLPPTELAAVVLLDRQGDGAACAPVDATSMTLLPYAIGFPHMGDRARQRFELCGAIAAGVPVLQLRAHPSLGPAALADLVQDAL